MFEIDEENYLRERGASEYDNLNADNYPQFGNPY